MLSVKQCRQCRIDQLPFVSVRACPCGSSLKAQRHLLQFSRCGAITLAAAARTIQTAMSPGHWGGTVTFCRQRARQRRPLYPSRHVVALAAGRLSIQTATPPQQGRQGGTGSSCWPQPCMGPVLEHQLRPCQTALLCWPPSIQTATCPQQVVRPALGAPVGVRLKSLQV